MTKSWDSAPVWIRSQQMLVAEGTWVNRLLVSQVGAPGSETTWGLKSLHHRAVCVVVFCYAFIIFSFMFWDAF